MKKKTASNSWDFVSGKSVKYFTSSSYQWPLIENNITAQDKKTLAKFILGTDKFTQGPKVIEFERQWSQWLGVKYSVFVNSGSAANFITLSTLRETHGLGEIILPPLTWVSDVVAVTENGFTPVFVDINPKTLAMDTDKILAAITSKTKAIFLTHVLGFNGLNGRLLSELKSRGIPLIEDACESHGATFDRKKVGSFGLASNFSFYYGHHMTTIEGGMICTNNPEFYEIARMKRAHGLLRESPFPLETQKKIKLKHQPWPEFTFPYVGCNFRSTELNAVLGLGQLKRLDKNNKKRIENFEIFLKNLNSKYFYTEFDSKGASNYALLILVRSEFPAIKPKVIEVFKKLGIEYRQGMSGGGNQIRQPYLETRGYNLNPSDFPVTEWVHELGFYIGNFAGLSKTKIKTLVTHLNQL